MTHNNKSLAIPAKYRYICILMIALMSLLVFWVYDQLPDPMPVHWNTAGVVDGWMSKPWGAFLMPFLMLASWLLLEVLSFISPKGFKLNDFIGVVGLLMTIIVAFLFIIGVAQVAFALGYPVQFTRVVAVAVGLLMLLTGNYFGKLKKNFFIGIRTPWTIANEEVWNRTHRLAGWTFVIAGFVIMVNALLQNNVAILVFIVLAAAAIPTAYSLWLYKQLED